MGAIMAAGIIDAGGRNVTIGLRSRSGYFRRTSVIGLAVFTQHWYVLPMPWQSVANSYVYLHDLDVWHTQK